MFTPTDKEKDTMQLEGVESAFELSPFPIDMFSSDSKITPDTEGIASSGDLAGYHPTNIVQYALSYWNQYLATNDERYRQVFLTQASWLVVHEARIGNDAGGWPISFPHYAVRGESPWLSASVQGQALSVLVRAYRLTREEVFLEVARRAVRTFHCDILDGGVSAPVGENEVFFEEIAVYPATHTLSGFIFALLGLYEYFALIRETQVEDLIQHSLITMHRLLGEFDAGFWTYIDLHHRQLSSPAHLALQTTLLEALATYSGCEHCTSLASRWKSYQRQLGSRLRYLIISRCTSFKSALLSRGRSILFPKMHDSSALGVCVPITAFPVTGGMHTILANVAQVTSDRWQIEYLTQHVGPNSEGLAIHRFGSGKKYPWQFPFVWFYVFAGFWKLISLMHRGANYDVILPQDGVFTGAFAALAAKLAGIRVVCIEHGNLTLLKSRLYRTERIQALATKSWPYRILARSLYMCYWPSLSLLAVFAARFVDHFLIPGVMGDGVEELCKQLGIRTSHITRFANMIDLSRHIVPDAALRARMREQNGIPPGAIVITMICRLAPEKGLDIALEAISQALSTLSPELRARIRVIIAGDGPLRRQVQEDINKRGLSKTCLLWGEASSPEVISLLGISDIFLYASRRGTGYPLAILEAMASGCAVIATSEPLANSHMLDDGRGIVVPVGDAEQVAIALVRMIKNPELCRQVGSLGRDHVAVRHSATELKRVLMRATYWSALDEILECAEKNESIAFRKSES